MEKHKMKELEVKLDRIKTEEENKILYTEAEIRRTLMEYLNSIKTAPVHTQITAVKPPTINVDEVA
jgi:hypothetical protein